jgi:hypothetical protein
MAETYKVLGQVLTGELALDNSTIKESVAYQVPAGTQAAISAIEITNSDTEDRNYKLSFVKSADASSATAGVEYIGLAELYLATGRYFVASSRDASNWSVSNTPIDSYGIAYGNNTAVSVGAHSEGVGGVAYSTDRGITWTSKKVGSYGTTFRKIAYGNGVFLAAADSYSGAIIMRSVDGINWSSVSPPSPGFSSSVAFLTYENNLFIFTGNDALMTSPDGITWTIRQNFLILSNIVYANELFLACDGNNDIVSTSLDGINWKSPKYSTSVYDMRGVVYFDGAYWMATDNALLRSNDNLRTWEIVNGFDFRINGYQENPNESLKTIKVINDRMLVISNLALYTFLTANSSFVFNTQPLMGSIGASSIAYGPSAGYVLCPEMSGNILTSQDGVTWTQRNLSDNNLSSIAYGQGRYVITNRSQNRIWHSTNAISWSYTTTSSAFRSVEFGDSSFAAVGTSGAAISYNGTSWSNVALPGQSGAASVAFANGYFVAVRDNKSAMYSNSGGESWQLSNTYVRNDVVSVVTVPTENGFSYKKFLINTSSEAASPFTSSQNGQSWELESNSARNSSRSIAHISGANGKFLATGSDLVNSEYQTRLFSSTDAITWEIVENVPSVGDLGKIVYSGEKFAIPTESGNVITSIDGITWTISGNLETPGYIGWVYADKVPTTLTQNIPRSLNKHVAIYNKTIASGETHEIKGGVTLSAGDQVRVYSNSSEIITNVYGVEIA